MAVQREEKIRMIEKLLIDFPEVIFKGVQDNDEIKLLLYNKLFFSSEEIKKEELESCAQEEPLEKNGTTIVEKIVTRYFKEMGIPANIKGYRYLREAIIMAIKKPEVLDKITKELYPELAKTFEDTSPNVERAIRHAIEVAFSRGNVDVLDRLFGYAVHPNKGKTTNSEFIAILADQIRLELKN